MRNSSAYLLQTATVLLGLSVAVFLLVEPNLEGRNAHATLTGVYFRDPFVACVYAASILFFVALYQAFKLFGYMRSNTRNVASSLTALRTIRFCLSTLIVLIVGAELYLMFIQHTEDDIAGGIALGLVTLMSLALMVSGAWLLERRLRRTYESI